MSCEICGRGSCSKGFHSSEEQQSFDNVADNVKERAREHIAHRIDRLDTEHIGDEPYVKLGEALEIVRDFD